MIVIDTSAALDLLLRTPHAAAIEAHVFGTAEKLHAPHLLDVEFLQVLRKWQRTGILSEPRAQEALLDLSGLGIIRHPHSPLLDRAWHLRHSITAYDAMFIALAEGLDAPLLTTDRKLSRSHDHTARIVCVAENT